MLTFYLNDLDQEYVESEDTKYLPFTRTCVSRQSTLWSVLLYAYKGLLLAFGAFLAWETRTVNVPALNDSRYIGISVYNVVLSCAMGITFLSVIEVGPDVQFIVVSVLVLVCPTITLCLVFIPKVKWLSVGLSFVFSLVPPLAVASVHLRIAWYGETPLLRPPSGQKNLAVLTR